MERLPDWEPRLVALANGWRTRPYVYGVSDCACFAQAAVEAVTGVLLLEGIEKPRGMMGAARFMISRGWESVEDMAEELLGTPVDPAATRRGDIVSFVGDGESHLAVRIGDVALSPSASGLAVIVPRCWHLGWKVG